MKTGRILYIIMILLLILVTKGFSKEPILKNAISETSSSSFDSNTPLQKHSTVANQSSIESSPNPISTNKEFVVVSKTPEFYSYTLTGLSILLTMVILAITFMTGAGFTLLKSISKETESLKSIKKSVEEEHTLLIKKLNADCVSHVQTLKLTAMGLVGVYSGKENLRNLLADDKSVVDDVYKELQKTIKYPDEECIRLYAKVLTVYEGNIDIVRLVRNGLLQYARNPQIHE
jgi:hypothetical protein